MRRKCERPLTKGRLKDDAHSLLSRREFALGLIIGILQDFFGV